jgi:hypothetical protein
MKQQSNSVRKWNTKRDICIDINVERKRKKRERERETKDESVEGTMTRV